ncbi:hypothetical protein [Acinetobacter sp. WCHAc010034]|uniref:hypothetical protein n=1 Tax=Acinetobacter sp. WCHAc010034 TaxID=1879049 RepID=UPI0013C32221|nr:hypothetical protein [Acinetobacter sp. WCHAc010034]
MVFKLFRLKHSAKRMPLSFFSSLLCICTSSYAMDEQAFEQMHTQILQDGYWAQVARYQLEEKLKEHMEHPAAQQAIQQKECLSKQHELKYYNFVIANFENFLRYRKAQGFSKSVPIEKLQQEAKAFKAQYELLKQTLKDTDYPCMPD